MTAPPPVCFMGWHEIRPGKNRNLQALDALAAAGNIGTYTQLRPTLCVHSRCAVAMGDCLASKLAYGRMPGSRVPEIQGDASMKDLAERFGFAFPALGFLTWS